MKSALQTSTYHLTLKVYTHYLETSPLRQCNIWR